jgi:hypothetical protein
MPPGETRRAAGYRLDQRSDPGWSSNERRGVARRVRVMGKRGAALVAVVFFVAVGAASMVAQARVPTESERRECERNGGYWDSAAGFCKAGA